MSSARFFFSVSLHGATSSIAVMRMLIEEAEHSINNSISKAQVEQNEFEDVQEDLQGNVYPVTQIIYSCGPCTDYDAEEARKRYEHLITQLTRRSAFLTIFGIFEYNMAACRDLMINLSGYDKKLQRGAVEAAEEALKKAIGCNDAPDLRPLSVLRNILAHNDGKYYQYKKVKQKPDIERTPAERRQFSAFEQAMNEYSGLSMDFFQNLRMDDTFLSQAVDTIEVFTKMLSEEVTNYANQKKQRATI